jgi:hypothetical protein
MKRIPVLLVLLAGIVQADVYKSVNDKGEVTYSDQPMPKAERMKLPELPTYSAPPLPRLSSTPESKPVASLYQSMKILEPENDATIRDNQGVVRVRIALVPPLMTKQGHNIQFYRNGEPYGPVSNTSITIFSNQDRGSYTLSASVLDAKGDTVMTSDPVTFYLHRESILNPNNPLNVKPKPQPLPSIR